MNRVSGVTDIYLLVYALWFYALGQSLEVILEEGNVLLFFSCRICLLAFSCRHIYWLLQLSAQLGPLTWDQT